MDNFHIDITSDSDSNLKLALKLAFSIHHNCVGYSLEKEKGILLHWWTNDKVIAFPSPLQEEELFPIVKSWLDKQDYGKQPDHDGDNEKGWRAYTDKWGAVGGDYTAFLAIKPAWAMYGK